LRAQEDDKETEVALESLFTVADPEQIQSIVQALPTVDQQQAASRASSRLRRKRRSSRLLSMR
jgi:hypothetical protein